MNEIMWLATIVFAFFSVAGGIATFFGSDYAQKKWNPENK